jgi:tetratricopeptide (TPR) repeat protein
MNALCATGRHEEAIRVIDRAAELDPLSMIINTATGWVRYFAGDVEGSIRHLRRAIEMFPEFMPGRVWLSLSLEQHGLLEEALAQAERGAAVGGRIPMVLSALGRAYARLGRTDEADAVIREFHELSKRRYVSPYNIAVVLEALGRPSEALDQLERAYAGRANFLALMKVDPRLAPLHGDPRYQDLERKMGFPQPIPAAH